MRYRRGIHRPAIRLGFTLIEMVLSLAIVSTLVTLAAPKAQEIIDKARVAKAITDIGAMQIDLTAYEGSHGAPPENQAGHGRRGGWVTVGLPKP